QVGLRKHFEHLLDDALAAAIGGEPFVDDGDLLHSDCTKGSDRSGGASRGDSASARRQALRRQACRCATPASLKRPPCSKARRRPSRTPSTVGGTTMACGPPASRSSGESATTTGVPQARASSTGMPKPSYSEGHTRACAPAYSAGIISSPM